VDDKSKVREACPETAEWINQVVAVFGKPRAIEVRDPDGRVIYRAGRFDDDPPKG